MGFFFAISKGITGLGSAIAGMIGIQIGVLLARASARQSES
ncbi:hypothetical protein APA_1906 [Pseudanabaena sp. lw0831]|nr:hypothetical protein APA_1906 [Pseudanabaena sp. lw0831]